jgi:inner membrane protein
MMGATHMAAGALVGYGVGVYTAQPPEAVALLAGLGVVCAILPDIDHPNSLIRNRTGVLGWLVGGWMNHRGITHTVPVAVAVGIVAALLLPVVAALVVFGAYASHLLLDALTRSGVPLAWPLSWAPVRLAPRPLQIRTGSAGEALFLLALVGAAALLELARRGLIG